jgi:cysteine synthase
MCACVHVYVCGTAIMADESDAHVAGRASKRAGCRILAKAEFLNPGGSVKDRAALFLIEVLSVCVADEVDRLTRNRMPNAKVCLSREEPSLRGRRETRASAWRTSATRGATSASSTCRTRRAGRRLMLCACLALKSFLCLLWLSPIRPTTTIRQAAERSRCQTPFGPTRCVMACVMRVLPLGSSQARQFDNVANAEGHFSMTGPEIWHQTQGRVTAFTCATGTGGTLAGERCCFAVSCRE